MADADVTDKEKESAQKDEKEQDTSRLSPPKDPPSKPGSAKSTKSNKPGARTPSAKDKSRTSSATKKPASKPASRASLKKKDEDPPSSPEPAELVPLPAGAKPVFLSGPTQAIFDIVGGEHVTEKKPHKLILKEAIVKDMIQRAGVSDFTPLKKVIQKYPGDEILVVYDADFAYGENFYIALTEEAKEKLLAPPPKKAKAKREGSAPPGDSVEGQEEAEVEEEEEEQEDVVYTYAPPVPKDWVSQGSEKEIEAENVSPSRPRIKFSVQRLRREFGAPVKFTDRSVTDAKDGYIECTSYEDKTFDLKKIELDAGVQAVPDLANHGTQTEWKHPRNANTQYYPREFSEKETQEKQSGDDFNTFITQVTPRFELALQQNEIMDVFYDDWINLADEDGSFGSKADNHLKEYQSFTDLQFSKDKTITYIDWHPAIKGVIAVSVAEKLSFDTRIDQSAKIAMKPSLILIWSFTDPIHPQLLLEAPDDIYCFKFSPSDPNIIAGGCINGQLVLWDISQHEERLKSQKSSGKKHNPMNTLASFDDNSALETPIMRYCAVSSIENSHRGAITDILWLPDHMEVNRMGIPQENRSQQCGQIMTCATDNCVLFWDTRPPKGVNQPEDTKGTRKPLGVPATFKYLDLTWKPHLKVHLSKSEPGGDHSPTKFSIQERQGDRSVLAQLGDVPPQKEPSSGGFNFGKPSSGKEKRTLQGVKTHFYVGGEDGEVIYGDWLPQKDQDTNKLMTPKPDFYNTLHDGPVNTVQRSPFFKDVVLFVGGWTFSVWKEGVTTGPILSSAASNKRLTSGFWSPSRPGVFYMAREDGSLDVWDLLDRTHEPSLNQGVSSAPITCIHPHQVSSKQHLLAVGDSSGTLHILEIPWSLRSPTSNELSGVANYIDREVKRRTFVQARWDFREQEKRQIEAEAKMKAGIAPNVQLTDDEVEYKMKLEYNLYVEEETAFLRQLGLKEDDPLPEIT